MYVPGPEASLMAFLVREYISIEPSFLAVEASGLCGGSEEGLKTAGDGGRGGGGGTLSSC